MEFHYAATGNTEALRKWLQQHPTRVNIPSVGTVYTLLHTATRGGHLATVQMLISEFHADPNVPCGGVGNTATHVAAAAGNVNMLSYFLACHVALKPNAFAEYPIDVANMLPHTHAGKDQCVAMLRAYERHQKERHVDPPSLHQQQPRRMEKSPEKRPLRQSPTPVATLRDTIQTLRVSSDDDKSSSLNHHHHHHHHYQQQQQEEKELTLPAPHCRGAVILTGPKIATLRNERNITEQSVLPLDLHNFRRTFGKGFEFMESSHLYSVRGLLPYIFKGVQYYTPVILIVVKPGSTRQPPAKRDHSNNDTAWGGSVNTGNGGGGGGGAAAAAAACTYRALIDRKRLCKLFINRRASYIDMNSGAIIPNSVDAGYGSLLEFVQHAVVANFEHIPPLTSVKDNEKSVQEDAPLFRIYPRERELRMRILRDLSMFCDDTFAYDHATRRVTGCLPLFVAPPYAASEGDAPAQPNSSGADRSAGGGKKNEVGANAILKLPFCLQFAQRDGFEESPRIYLTNATTATSETRMNYAVFSTLIIDSMSGEVHRTMLPSLGTWKRHGSLFTVLTELQKTAMSFLLEYSKTSAPSHTGGRASEAAAAAAAAALTTTATTATTTNTTSSFSLISTPVSGVKQSDTLSSWSTSCGEADCLLVGHPPKTHATACEATVASPVKSKDNDKQTATQCVICLDAERNTLLLPCRHLLLCRACSIRYMDRLTDGMLCPLCRVVVEKTMEVYI